LADRVGEHNLARLAEGSLDRHGDYDSLFFEGSWHSSGWLAERAQRLAAGLVRLGVEPGDRIVVLMSNCPDVGVAYQAAWRAGAVLTPAVFLLTPTELRHLFADSGARAVITTPDLAGVVREARQGVGALEWVVTTGDAGAGELSTAELEQAEAGPVVPRADGDLAALMYTGGTTGRAKGVMLSHEMLWRAGEAGYDASYVPGVNRSLVTLPLSHAYGMLVTVVGLHAREPNVAALLRWFDPVSFLTLTAEHRLQSSAVVPSMIQALLACPVEELDLSSLRYLVCGAAPLAPESVRALSERLPQVELREGYGLTECCALASTNPPGRARAGSVGLPVPGVEVRIVDEGDEEVARGDVGEICCRSPFVMLGYWNDPQLTADVTRGGWLHTGDMGYVDEDGYLFIVDRMKDLIIRGGFNVFPRDVEDALLEHAAVAAAGVVGRPDEAHGEEVVAFVELRSGFETDEPELVAYAKERLGGYKYPREIKILPQVPLTPVGKVDRKALRALAEREE
jgi:long-chain acyl-CoA synthetase